MKKVWPLVFGISLFCIVIGAACSRSATITTNQSATTSTPTSTRGLSFSPAAITAEGITTFFNLAAAAGSYVSWGGPISDLEKSGGGAQLVIAQAKTKSLTPIIIVSPTASNLKNDGEWKLWRDTVVVFAQHSQVPYLGIGNETNKNVSTSELAYFASQYQLLVDDIHRASPTTKVFTIFQLEWMKGLRGGLFGGKNTNSQAQWDLLTDFRFGDLIAFSSYPGLIYKNPSDIPDSYYQEILEHTDRPIALTELGWFRAGPSGWGSSVDEQVAFIDRFFTIMQPTRPIFTLWSFLYDQAAAAPFSTMGLLTAEQTTSSAWEAWKNGPVD